MERSQKATQKLERKYSGNHGLFRGHQINHPQIYGRSIQVSELLYFTQKYWSVFFPWSSWADFWKDDSLWGQSSRHVTSCNNFCLFWICEALQFIWDMGVYQNLLLILVGWTPIYIHLPAILMFTRGTTVLTHTHRESGLRACFPIRPAEKCWSELLIGVFVWTVWIQRYLGFYEQVHFWNRLNASYFLQHTLQ